MFSPYDLCAVFKAVQTKIDVVISPEPEYASEIL